MNDAICYLCQGSHGAHTLECRLTPEGVVPLIEGRSWRAGVEAAKLVYEADRSRQLAIEANMKMKTEHWEFFCEHANENPNVCPCPATCGCRQVHCKGKIVREQLTDFVQVRQAPLAALEEMRFKFEKLGTATLSMKQVCELIHQLRDHPEDKRPLTTKEKLELLAQRLTTYSFAGRLELLKELEEIIRLEP